MILQGIASLAPARLTRSKVAAEKVQDNISAGRRTGVQKPGDDKTLEQLVAEHGRAETIARWAAQRPTLAKVNRVAQQLGLAPQDRPIEEVQQDIVQRALAAAR